MSNPTKRAKMEDANEPECASTSPQNSSGSMDSQSPELPRKKAFNFWKCKKEISPPKEEDPNKDKTLSSLSVGWKDTWIVFRVSHIGMSQTKWGNRLAVKAYDETGVVEMCAFRETADKLFNLLKVNEAYELRYYFVKEPDVAKGTWFQIDIDKSFELKPAMETSIPGMTFYFRDIESVEQHYETSSETDKKADFVGIAVNVGSVGRTKKGHSMMAVDLTDKTKGNMELKFWGKIAEKVQISLYDVVVVRLAGVKKYSDQVYLNFESDTGLLINPDLAEATDMKEWFNAAREQSSDLSDDPMGDGDEDTMMEQNN